jgi:glycosyltransferase involved in cell wall biosynthesis
VNNLHYVVFHHSFDRIAGTERVIYNLLELFATYQDSRVTLLLAGSPSELALDITHWPINIIYLDAPVQTGSTYQLLTSHIKLYKCLKNTVKHWNHEENFVCLATNPFLAVMMKRVANKTRQRIVIIACEHFSLSVSGKLSLFARKLYYKHFYVVTLTQKDRVLMEERYHPIQCICIPNASSFEIAPYHTFKRDQTILAIGRLTAQKGFDLLIQSYALIANNNSGWKLLIVGDDYGEQKHLEELIDHHDLRQKVSILPATKDIIQYYRSAGLYALSSRFEGLPMVLIEAMSFGLPLIAFDCPTGPAELVNSENGLLVENGNVHKFAEALESLMQNPEVLHMKAIGAEKQAAGFTKEKINKVWNHFISEILIKLK